MPTSRPRPADSTTALSRPDREPSRSIFGEPSLSTIVCGLLVVLAAGCSDDASSNDPSPPDASQSPLPFRAEQDHLAVEVDDGDYRPIFMRGANLGVGVPGTRAGELAAAYEDYRDWFEQMREAGVNVLRIYTLHFPRFYEALADHNADHPDDPLYVMHGVWLDEENPSDDLLDLTDQLDQGIEEAVDCAHGNCSIDHRYGRAYGEYEVDISQWIIGWIVGREVAPHEVIETNEAHPEMTSFEGEAFRVDDGDPVEVWFAERLDYLVTYERNRYDTQRPVSVSSWPTLDPMEHPTESSTYSSEDIASFDMSRIEPVDAPGGLFATYHAYPYYPDFVVEDPDYREYEDEQGPNSYKGYLEDLRAHHDDMPLFIGEFGVPSSWGNAHWGYEGMNHGGHDEVEQGEVNGRLMRTIHQTDCAGGAVFAWIDEWWKPTWITDPFDSPPNRRPLWHNIVAPEQNFGLVAFESEEPTFRQPEEFQLGEAVADVKTAADETFFRVRLTWNDMPDEPVVVGLDTYGDELGERILPDGTEASRRSEFALVVDGTESAELYVTEAYDLFGISLNTSSDEQKYRSVPTDGAPWHLVRWQNGQEHTSEDGEMVFEPTYHDIGELRVRAESAPSSSLDAVIVGDDQIEIRLPWSLLNVVDPSRREVMHDDRDLPGRQTAITEGIALSVGVDGTEVATTARSSWPTWEDPPPTEERIKAGMEPFTEALEEMPYWVD